MAARPRSRHRGADARIGTNYVFAPPPMSANLAALGRGVRAGDRPTIARAITLVESRRGDHQKIARRLVQDLLPATG